MTVNVRRRQSQRKHPTDPDYEKKRRIKIAIIILLKSTPTIPMLQISTNKSINFSKILIFSIVQF